MSEVKAKLQPLDDIPKGSSEFCFPEYVKTISIGKEVA